MIRNYSKVPYDEREIPGVATFSEFADYLINWLKWPITRRINEAQLVNFHGKGLEKSQKPKNAPNLKDIINSLKLTF